jgi:hypothetical protein
MGEPQVELTWFRGQCADLSCAEVAGDVDHVYIRDSKSPATPALRFSRAEWDAFRDGVKLGDFDQI